MIRLPLITAALVAVLWWLFHISKRKSLRVVLIVFAIIIALPLGLLFAQWGYELNMRLRAGRITAQLESYRASHGKCPVSLSDLRFVRSTALFTTNVISTRHSNIICGSARASAPFPNTIPRPAYGMHRNKV